MSILTSCGVREFESSAQGKISKMEFYLGFNEEPYLDENEIDTLKIIKSTWSKYHCSELFIVPISLDILFPSSIKRKLQIASEMNEWIKA